MGLIIVFVILIIIVGAIYGIAQSRKGDRAEWTARAVADNRAEMSERRWNSIEEALATMRAADDAFSFVLFEDFLYALYGEVHAARGTPDKLDTLAAYLSPNAIATLRQLGGAHVDAAVIGGMRIDRITTTANDPNVRVGILFTTNLSEQGGAFYQEERWTLARNLAAKSRAPDRARTIDCPSCGAPRDKTVGGKCGYCGAAPTQGGSDWFVESIQIVAREARGPMLTGTTEEIGTDWPTVVARDVQAQIGALQREDPSFVWPGFIARVEKTFYQFHQSWCAQDLTAVRPYLSDNLFELQKYWVRAYQSQGLRNMTEGARVVTVHLARVTRDRFFHSITVRVFATCKDYTLDAQGNVVGGNRNAQRDYSEYWTFVRGVGTKGGARSDNVCPSCGAPLTGVNMAGKCGACGAKVTSGQFDWVLSRIEQDEVYERAA